MQSPDEYVLQRANEVFGHKPANAGTLEAFIAVLVITIVAAIVKWM